MTLVSVGVGVHRSLEAADEMGNHGISVGVVDLQTVRPLDKLAVCQTVAATGRLLVVDEDYEGFALSGELAALLLEAGIRFNYGRVCTQTTIPYAGHLEFQALPNVHRICDGIMRLLEMPRREGGLQSGYS